MSFPPQRFFSLSSSSRDIIHDNNNNAPTSLAVQQAQQHAASTSALPSSTTSFPLDLLVRAASGNGNNSSLQHNINIMDSHNVNGMSSLNGMAGGPNDAQNQGSQDNVNANNNTTNIQQFLQQASAGAMAPAPSATHPSAIFGGSSTNGMNFVAQQNGGPMAGVVNPPAQSSNQFGQFFGNHTNTMASLAQQAQVGATPISMSVTHSHSAQSNTPQAGNTSTTGGATTNNNNNNNPANNPQQQQQPQDASSQQQGNMISQLVASLQAQQQAQQQAQVQAALVRAFGPGANTTAAGGGGGMGGMNAMAGLQGNGMGAHAVVGGAHQGGQGMGMGGGVAGMQGSAASDLLSRMQLAQSVQQQQVQQQQQQQQTSNAADDDLIKLQIEQERHNRMLQMVQADRQERAMLANQEAMMKKQRKDLKKGGPEQLVGTMGGLPLVDPASVGLNDAVKTMFQQFPHANPLAGVASAGGFPNASSLLTNAASQFANAATKIPGLNHHPSPLQNGLLNNNLLGGGLVAGGGGDGVGVNGAVEHQHLHQKLGSARGAAIVPCRARGMPVDHNFKTAYFVIPDGIEHGDELMCSYPACRQAGVKFRYCLHCKVPVAKRNFRNRHRHGVPGGDGAEEVEESDSEEEEAATKTGEDGVAACGNEICQPVDDEDYMKGVKKEHILIIPGTEPDQPTAFKKKKKKKSVRVPCRARGMPMAHNFKTAYFIIPPTIEHGDELLCSFPSCRSAGAKFRYCLHCKVPVAKRNFRNRHKHGNLGGFDKKKSASGGNLKTPETPDAKSGEAKVPELPKLDGGEKPAAVDVAQSSEESKPEAKAEATKSEEAADAPSASNGTVNISSTQDVGKVQEWVQLMENKPDPSDKQAMAVWMMSLMNATSGGDGIPAPAAADVDAPAADVEDKKPAAKTEAEIAPVDALATTVAEEADKSSTAEEEGSANSSDSGVAKRESTEEKNEEDASSTTSSGSSQPPKKKFKQEYEEV